MTRVEEWTREDTGVGAAIAAGSQAEKGIWALFVQAATATKEAVNGVRAPGLRDHIPKSHEPHGIAATIASRRRPSPSRLVKAVTIPALKDLEL